MVLCVVVFGCFSGGKSIYLGKKIVMHVFVNDLQFYKKLLMYSIIEQG